MRTRQVTQFGPVSPSPVSLVIAPSRVLISGIVGCSDDAVDTVGVPEELVAIVRRVVRMSQIEQFRE
jgi:hypothetical protein